MTRHFGLVTPLARAGGDGDLPADPNETVFGAHDKSIGNDGKRGEPVFSDLVFGHFFEGFPGLDDRGHTISVVEEEMPVSVNRGRGIAATAVETFPIVVLSRGRVEAGENSLVVVDEKQVVDNDRGA